MNIKNILALITSFTFILLIFSFSVSAQAVNESPMTNQEYYASQIYLISEYCDGKITYSQFQEQSQAVTNEYVNNNTVGGVLHNGALNASNTVSAVSKKIGATVNKYGEAAKDKISEWIAGFIDNYTILNDTSTTDLNGYGALYYGESFNNRGLSHQSWYYTDYIVLSNNAYSGEMAHASFPKDVHAVDKHLLNNGEWSTNESDTFNIGFTFSFSEANAKYYFYGDVRFEDGTQAPTNDEYITVKDYDFTQVPENDLEKLLQKFLNELELQQPDLSTIEGLLRAIYYQTAGINNNMITYDECNALIMSLIQSQDNNSQAIVEALLAIREDLKKLEVSGGKSDKDDNIDDDTEKNSSLSDKEISGTLYNVKPLDKNWLQKLLHDSTELRVEYQGKTYYLESDGTLKIDGKYYYVDMNYESYSTIDFDFSNDDIDVSSLYYDFDYINLSGLSSSQKKKIENVVSMVGTLLAKGVPYAAVNGGLLFYQDIIFNSNDPYDIVLDLNFMGNEFHFTLLSTEFYNSEIKESLAIVKGFIMIIVGYAWLLAMRKKVTLMMG